MTLAQLRYLLAIVDSDLNITIAADRVNTTQPAVSKQLKLLEEELGFQIFSRRGKSLAGLSPAGAQVVERARVIMSEAANIRALAANHRQDDAGELVIATTQTQARFVLPTALKALKERYPNVRVRLNLFSDSDGSALARQDADLLIASSMDWPQSPDLTIPLYRWKRVALTPHDHALTRFKHPLSLGELAAFPLIGYESALGSHAHIAAAFASAGWPAQFAYAAHDTEVIKTFVRSGFGVGLLAEMATGDEDDKLTSIPVNGLPECAAYALLRRDRVARDFVVDFVTYLAPHVSRRDLTRGLQPGGGIAVRTPPEWRDWQKLASERAHAPRRKAPSEAAA